MKNNEINNLFKNAVNLYNAKNYRDAFTLCESILKLETNHLECNYMFGLLYMKSGNYDLAIKYFCEADKLNPNNPMYLNSIGLALIKKDKISEAEKYFLKSIKLKPEFIKPYINLAKLNKSINKIDDAENYYKKVLTLEPDSITALNNLGNILQEKDELEEALICYDKIIKINPNKSETLCNKANIYERQEKDNQAKTYYLKALSINPNFSLAHINLGKLYLKISEYISAISCIKKAVTIEPKNSEYLVQLGGAYYKNGEYELTEKYCKKALQLNPKVSNAFLYLGMVINQKGFLEDSLKLFLEEQKLSADKAEVYYAIGSTYFELKNYKKATDNFEKAIEIESELLLAQYGLIQIRADLCDWSKRKKDESLFIDLLEKQFENKKQYKSFPILTMNNFSVPLNLHSSAAKYYSEMYSKKVFELKSKLNFKYNKKVKQKLKIGYISPDFRQHAVGLLIKDLFKNHDKSKFEIYCYSLLPEMKDDVVQNSIKEGSNYFHTFYESSYENAAKKINDDGINILIDLAGYTTFSKTEIMALKPAQIHAQFLGYPNTMGADFIDYIISDSTIITDELTKYYTERIAYIPQAFVYSKLDYSNKDLKRKDYGLPEDAFVFCSFNRANKIEPDIFEIWMSILKSVPNSILWLSSTNENVITNLKNEAEKKDISKERIIFKGRLSREDYMAIHKLADLFLDTFLYNAGSTGVFSIAAGLPILTNPGNSFASRMSASILNSVDLPELISKSKTEYESKAIYYGQNLNELNKLKKKIIANNKTAPLFNIKNFVGYLEQSYIKMWEIYEKGEKPKNIKIS